MKNYFFQGDNLKVMRGLKSESVNLCYLDPPFNTRKTHAKSGGEFSDAITPESVSTEDFESLCGVYPALSSLMALVATTEGKNSVAYLSYMAIRIAEIKRLLADDGSVFVHCDVTSSHMLKLMMDCIFGAKSYRNTIIHCYTGLTSPHCKQFPRKHDDIHWYSKGENWTFVKQS